MTVKAVTLASHILCKTKIGSESVVHRKAVSGFLPVIHESKDSPAPSY